MGYYIDAPGMSSTKKAEFLIEHYGAEVVDIRKGWDVPSKKVLICVIQNGPFDAAGIAYSPREAEEFADARDNRPKTWLAMDRGTVLDLCPNAKTVLPV